MNRFDLLEKLQDSLKDKLVICNIGLPSQELYQINDQPNYFYLVLLGLNFLMYLHPCTL